MVGVALLALVLSGLLSFSTAADAHPGPDSSAEIVKTATGVTTGQNLSEEYPAPFGHCKDSQAGHCAPLTLYMDNAKGRCADLGELARFPRFGSLIPHGFVAPDIPPPKFA
jgi:hypothetical protein